MLRAKAGVVLLLVTVLGHAPLLLQLPFARGGALRGDGLLPRPFLAVLLGAVAIFADTGVLTVAVQALRPFAPAITTPVLAVPAVVATVLPVAVGLVATALPAIALRLRVRSVGPVGTLRP